MKSKRQKAFIGTAISVGTSLIGGAIKNAKQKKAAREQAALEQANQVKSETFQQASALQQYMNNDAADEFIENKITLKNGGKVNMDRVKQAKKFACGGRTKKQDGGSKIGNFLKTDAGNSAINAIGTLGSALMDTPVIKQPIQKSAGFSYGPKTAIVPNSYNTENMLIQQRFGGKTKAKCK